ncbi:MAG: phosphatidate cytidylyltransferase [Pseudomonadota bacterium]
MEARGRFGDLKLRMASSLVLATIAFIALWFGGWIMTLIFGVTAALLMWELRRIHHPTSPRDAGLWVMVICAVGSVVLTAQLGFPFALGELALGALVLLALAAGTRRWMVGGLFYISLALSILVLVRENAQMGFAGALFIVMIVIATDVGGYFCGKTLGGPKLWQKVSPKKTWSGAFGGLLLAGLVGLAFTSVGVPALPGMVALGLILAVASMAGDLLESAYKRRFAAKDASGLVPGHGGLMDRLDGVLAASLAFGALSWVWPGV